MNRCLQCGEDVRNSTPVCPACGAVTPGAAYADCELHADVPAVALCVVCGKPVCGDCAVRSGGRFTCDVPTHKAIVTETSVLATCSSPFEADLIRENLRQAGLETLVFDRSAFIGLHRSATAPTEVRIRNDQTERAASVLRNLALDEESRRES